MVVGRVRRRVARRRRHNDSIPYKYDPLVSLLESPTSTTFTFNDPRILEKIQDGQAA
jgi:hypothetical protein